MRPKAGRVPGTARAVRAPTLMSIQPLRVRPPITRVYAMADAGQALRDVMERRVKGKVVVRIRD